MCSVDFVAMASGVSPQQAIVFGDATDKKGGKKGKAKVQKPTIKEKGKGNQMQEHKSKKGKGKGKSKDANRQKVKGKAKVNISMAIGNQSVNGCQKTSMRSLESRATNPKAQKENRKEGNLAANVQANRRERSDNMGMMLLRVMADLDFHDMQYNVNEKHLSSIRIYNFVKKSIQTLILGDIPWPITYILTRFNRKHISTPPCKPNPDDVTNALDEFIS
jgi:hypothetical protein